MLSRLRRGDELSATARKETNMNCCQLCGRVLLSAALCGHCGHQIFVPPAKRDEHVENREPAAAIDEGSTVVFKQATSGTVPALEEESFWPAQQTHIPWNAIAFSDEGF